jgi:flavin reductase (DIM6/NTAB) family NADH-FMN oxidoreductase RutF
MALAASPPLVAPADYVGAISQHVSSVCVITTEHDGQRYGLTATAVSSVTADPPRLLVCVNKSGVTHDRILAAGQFCVNVLAEDQDRVAMVFAGMGGKDVDRFATGDWTRLVTGAPALMGASAVFDCRLGETVNQSTHSIFFGEVVAVESRKAVDTLLYGARRFRQLRKVFSASGEAADWL